MFEHAVFLYYVVYIYIHPTIWNTQLDPHPLCVVFSVSKSRDSSFNQNGVGRVGPLASIAGEDRNFVLGIT